MKNTILCLLLLLATNAQSKFCQVVYISSLNSQIQKNDGFYMYENEDLKIVYSFWAEDGLMGFMIYNKTNHPLYIDWKKSAMIFRGKQNPYYTNKTTSNYTAYGVSYGFGWATAFNRSAVGAAFGGSEINAVESIVHQERITFIPPHSYISNAFYNILAHFTSFTIDRQKVKPFIFNDRKGYEVEPQNPMPFRNFITYSATEDFVSESYIDNEFKVAKVATIHKEDFNNSGDWQKPTRFYIYNIKREDIF